MQAVQKRSSEPSGRFRWATRARERLSAVTRPAGHAAKNPDGGLLFLPKRWRRRSFLKWLRRTHAWIGLWGAIMGLLFGVTGILLNHRTVMKIPAAQVASSRVQLPLPSLPASPEELTTWLRRELELGERRPFVTVEPARPVGWGSRSIQQPERWQIDFYSPKQAVLAEYWRGNHLVSITRKANNAWAMLTNLHMATGVNAAWILLTDTLAGGLLVLALTGTLLWTRLHGPRLLAAGLALGSLCGLVVFGASSL